jgi:mannose-6-phosphate isomerase-like protein (cupin superfamily)
MALSTPPCADHTRRMPAAQVIKQDDIPFSVFSREFVGADHGGVGVSFLLVDAEPGRGPRLHKHDYDEVFIVQEGGATMTIGDEQHEVGAGDIVVVPAGQPHAFVNSGSGRLRQVDIHVNPRFATEWLE